MASSKRWWFGAVAAAAILTATLMPGIAQKADAQTLVKVRYEEVIRSVFYLPSYIALSKGFFKDEGLDVSMKTSWGSDKGTAALLSGTADIVLVGPETAAAANVVQADCCYGKVLDLHIDSPIEGCVAVYVKR